MKNLDPEQMAPELIGVGAQAMIEQARRLGLTWNLRPATVNFYDRDTQNVTITYDGDTVSIGAVSLCGGLFTGARVMGMQVPPGGNFIVGTVGPVLGYEYIVYLLAPAASTTSAWPTYVNMGTVEPVRFTYTKLYDETDVRVHANIQLSVNPGLTNTIFQLNDGAGHTVEVGRKFINAASTHGQISTVVRWRDLPSGTYTMNLQWARLSGTGTLSTGTDDVISLALKEITPE